MAAKLSLLENDWTSQPQGLVSLKNEFDHKGRGFCFLPSLGWFTTSGNAVSLAVTSSEYSGPRFSSQIGGKAIRLYAQTGEGANDDRLQSPFSVGTAAAGAMTTVVTAHILSGAARSTLLPSTSYVGVSSGHGAAADGGALQVGYFGDNGYDRYSASIDSSPLFSGPQTIVISTVPGQDCNAAMSGVLATSYTGNVSYIGSGTLPPASRSTTGDGGWANLYNPDCHIYLWGQLPGVFLSADRVLSLSRNPWEIFDTEETAWFTPTVTAQFARPTSDASTGTWTASTGSDLFAMLDETSANDADYIVTTGASTCEVALGSLSDPAVSTGHKVRYRLSANTGGITVRLREGTTTIATWTHNPAPSSLTTYTQTLSGGEADSITNYAALKLQFEATA